MIECNIMIFFKYHIYVYIRVYMYKYIYIYIYTYIYNIGLIKNTLFNKRTAGNIK